MTTCVRVPLLAVVLVAAACSDDGKLGAAESATGGTTQAEIDDTTGLPGQSMPATTGPGATSGAEVTGGDGSGASDTGMDSVGFISGASTGDAPAPNGSDCFSDETCESGHCFIGGNGNGVCSECLTDADCEMGGCQFGFQTGYAFCNDGSAGATCESDAACQKGLTCEEVFPGSPFGSGRCSACATSLDCAPGQVCGPTTMGGFGGAHLDCLDAMSVGDGGLCPVDAMGVGDATVCMSGECATTTVFMNSVTVGICSECDADEDCGPMQTCAPPDFMMGMITPGACQ